MGLTGVENGEDPIAKVNEPDSSFTIFLSFFFSDCTNRTATNVVLLNRCRSYSIYDTKLHIYLSLLRVKLVSVRLC